MISIIIPVYNAGKLINKCLKSVLGQTFKDIEVIIVNDCSTDELTNQLLEEWKSKDPRIKYVKKKNNEGIEKARFTGLEYVSGDYLMFMDHDDWYYDKMSVEKMFHYITETGADVVMGHAIGAVGPFSTKYVERISSGIYSHQEFMDNFYNSFFGVFNFSVNLWDKIYRYEIVKKASLRPRNLSYTDDACFNMFVLPHANSIYVMQETVYVHRWGGYSSKYTDSVSEYCKLYKAREEAMSVFSFPKGKKTSDIQMKNLLKFDIQLRILLLKDSKPNILHYLESLIDNQFWNDLIRSPYIIGSNDIFAQSLVKKDCERMYTEAAMPLFTNSAIIKRQIKKVIKFFVRLFI